MQEESGTAGWTRLDVKIHNFNFSNLIAPCLQEQEQEATHNPQEGSLLSLPQQAESLLLPFLHFSHPTEPFLRSLHILTLHIWEQLLSQWNSSC